MFMKRVRGDWNYEMPNATSKDRLMDFFSWALLLASGVQHIMFCYVMFFKQALIEETMEKSVKYTDVQKSYREASYNIFY
jgi:hypothetical protein